jgi:tRNA-specific 2-thiouridylase
VDSAVTLALLRALECEVQCVTFKNFCYSDEDAFTDKSCCSLEAIEDARRLARSYDAPHWVGDVEKPFRRQVIDPFIADYSRARTPNPCLDCNGVVRFPELVRLAERQGCRFAATGHYARLDSGRLLKGLDPGKDQSYFLHRIDRRLFDRLLFPLGWYVKQDVRAAAHALGIRAAEKRDSQEICFVPDGDRTFLFEQVPEASGGALVPGEIVNRAGEVLGRHRGLIHYTVGQRRGLGVAAPEPLYVLELDLAASRLVVGQRDELETLRVTGDDFTAAVDDFPDGWEKGQGLTADRDGDGEVRLAIRHRHAGALVTGWSLASGVLSVDLAEPVDGAAPGQGMVLYAGDTVLGGARISGAE